MEVMEQTDGLALLIQYILPWTGSFIIGALAGIFYGRHKHCRMCLAATLFVLKKLHDRGVVLVPYDIAVINIAIDHINRTK